MAFFFPEADSQIDWSRGFEFLDGELQQISCESETGKRITDKLVKVCLRNGEEQWIVAHIEVQNQKEPDFSERVFIYFARLRDKFQREVSSFVVLGDTDANWRPQSFTTETLACYLQFSFPIAKLVDYKQRQGKLEVSGNPCAVVVQAHLAAQATKGKESQQRCRKQKFALMTMLYEKRYSRQEIIDLFWFIDWVLTLPSELEEAFINDLATYEGDKNMPYITSIERMGEARGKAELVIRQLNRWIGLVAEEIVLRIGKLPIDQLEQLGEDLLDFISIHDLADRFQHATDS